MYVEINEIPLESAKKGMELFSREKLAFAPLKGFGQSIERAIRQTFIDEPVSESQAEELVDLLVD